MTTPSFQSFLVVSIGWILTPERRTVTGMIQGADAVGTKDHSAFHRFFSSARWSLNEMSRVLLTILLRLVPHDGVVYLAIDDTLCRKRGLHIFGTCMHHDPLISCRNFRLVNWGHNWVVVGLIVELPFAPGVYWCLPFAFRLYISQKRARSQRWKCGRRAHRTRPELAVEIIKMIAGWLPDRRFHLLGDSAYGGGSVLKELPENFQLTSRIVLDACLHDDPKPTKGRGRPRTKGKRLPTPAQVARSSSTKWRTRKVQMYGKKRTVQFKSHTGRWKAGRHRRVNITIVRDPSGKTKDQAFYTTDLEMRSEEALAGYAMRWCIEVAFQNAKSHFGFQDPQNRTRRAVERTAPMGMVLYSLVIVWFANAGHKCCRYPNRPWYTKKSTPSFLDMLATLKRESMRENFREDPAMKQGGRKILRLFDRALRLVG
jgi:SRSO17 transposase